MRQSIGFRAPSVWSRTIALVILFGSTFCHACGPSPVAIREGGEESTSAGAEPAPDDTAALLADVVAPRICGQLRGSFVGLPGDGGRTGPEAGEDPSWGRWWIRGCQATQHDGLIELSIEGPGWTYVDRESSGFRVRQYLRFESTAAFTARMEIGYDRERRIATVWMRPLPDAVRAEVRPIGLIRAEATNLFSDIVGGVLSATGDSADARARRTVADEGSTQLRERFQTGLTVTYSLDTEQMDFMVGALDRGMLPSRPFPTETGVTWSVNQRLMVWPGGHDVIGPIPRTEANTYIDLALEEGVRATVDSVCADDFAVYYDQVLQGGQARQPNGIRLFDVDRIGEVERHRLTEADCPALLIIAPAQPVAGATASTDPVRVRIRVGRHTNPPPQEAAAAVAVRPPPALRIQVASFRVASVAPSGSSWDVFGGAADPYIVVASVPGQREVFRSTARSDVHQVTLSEWLPGAFHPHDFPLRFTLVDEDVTSDEPIGIAELRYADARNASVELVVSTTGAVPQRVGSIVLQTTPVD